MPTQPYFNKAGQRLPSVTTIISRFKESGGLIHWAWNLGREGQDYRQVRDEAADAGTLAHAMIEEDNLGMLIAIDDDGNVYSGSSNERPQFESKGMTVIE